MATRRTRTAIAPPPPAPIPTAQQGNAAPPDPIHADLIARLSASHNTISNDGAPVTLDVQPDVRFPLLAWIYHVNHSIHGLTFQSHPHASPASLIGYTLTMFYALHFFCDSALRPEFSPLAAQIMDSAMLNQFFQTLLDLNVPAFAVHEFESLRPYFDDLASNLNFIPSFAGADFRIDFGRIIPASYFFTMHNIMASLPANSPQRDLLRHFYRTTIATVNFNGTDIPLTPGNFDGFLRTTTAHPEGRTYNNWFANRAHTLFSASAIRPVFTSTTGGNLPFFALATTTAADMNAYTFGTSISQDNYIGILNFMRSISQFIQTVYPASRPLRAYTQVGNQESTRYLSFRSPIPTWHTDAVTLPQTPAANTDDPMNPMTARRTHLQFSTDLNIFASRADPTGNHANDATLTNFPAPDGTPDTTISVQLVETAAPPANTVDPVQYHAATANDATPNAVIFDPSSADTAHLAAVLTSGKIIETHDHASVGINTENANQSLYWSNAAFFATAIPYRMIHNGFNNHARYVRVRSSTTNYNHDSVHFFGPAHQVLLPLFRQGHVRRAAASNVLGTAFFPGITWLHHARHARDAINVIAFTTDTTVATHDDRINLWSSYRWYNPKSRTWMMLPTLRPIFGLRARLFQTQHPAIRVPIA